MDQYTLRRPKLSALKFSIIYGIVVASFPVIYYTFLVVFDLLNEYYGDDIGGGMRIPTYLFIMPFFMSVAIYRFRKMNEGMLLLKNALIIGVSMAITTSMTMILYHILFDNLLAPSFHSRYYEQFGNEIYQELVACCKYTIEEFERHKRVRIEYSRLYYIDIVFAVAIALITSSIAGLIMRRKTRKE